MYLMPAFLLTWLYNSRVEAARMFAGIFNRLPLQIKALAFVDATFGKNILVLELYSRNCSSIVSHILET